MLHTVDNFKRESEYISLFIKRMLTQLSNAQSTPYCTFELQVTRVNKARANPTPENPALQFFSGIIMLMITCANCLFTAGHIG